MSNLATLKPFKKGHKKKGGVKKGYKSLTSILRDELQKLTYAKDGKQISYQKALINKLIHQAIIEGNSKAMLLIWEYVEGKPKATLDLSIKELPAPLLNGESGKNIPI